MISWDWTGNNSGGRLSYSRLIGLMVGQCLTRGNRCLKTYIFMMTTLAYPHLPPPYWKVLIRFISMTSPRSLLTTPSILFGHPTRPSTASLPELLNYGRTPMLLAIEMHQLCSFANRPHTTKLSKRNFISHHPKWAQKRLGLEFFTVICCTTRLV